MIFDWISFYYGQTVSIICLFCVKFKCSVVNVSCKNKKNKYYFRYGKRDEAKKQYLYPFNFEFTINIIKDRNRCVLHTYKKIRSHTHLAYILLWASWYRLRLFLRSILYSIFCVYVYCYETWRKRKTTCMFAYVICVCVHFGATKMLWTICV